MRLRTTMMLRLFSGMKHLHPREIMVQHRKIAYGRIKRSMVLYGHKYTRDEMVKSAFVFLSDAQPPVAAEK